MFKKATIALFAAIAFGAASSALAKDRDADEGGGFEVQTWQDIQKARKNIQDQIRSQYPTANDHGRDAYGFRGTPNQKHGASTKENQR
jgi:hypothetical protein